MIKRKGQIVPRYLCESIEPKARHLVKFGCDVEIKGRVIKGLSRGYIITVPFPCVTHVLKKKNQRKVKGFIFKGLVLIPFKPQKSELAKAVDSNSGNIRFEWGKRHDENI